MTSTRFSSAIVFILALFLSSNVLAAKPVISSVATTGPGHYEIVVRGTNFVNSYVDTRPWGQGVNPVSHVVTMGMDGAYQTLTFAVTAAERASLDGDGLGIWVVNATTPYEWNDVPARIQRDIAHNIPKISSVTATPAANNRANVVVLGTDFIDAYVDTRPWGQFPTPVSYSATAGFNGSQQSLSFTITATDQMALLNGAGLGVTVVNRTNPYTWNTTPVRVQLSSNQPPSVFLSATPGGTLVAPANFQVRATATDPDGQVTRVIIRRNGSVIQDSPSGPWVVTQSNIASGTYAYTATAFDNSGASAEAQLLTVSVQAAQNNVPVLQDAQLINNSYQIKVRGSNFINPYIDTRPWGVNTAPTRYQPVIGTEGSLQTLTFTVTDSAQMAQLDGNGLGIWVVNRTSPTAWNANPLRIQRQGALSIQLTASPAGGLVAPANFTVTAATVGAVRVTFTRNGTLVLDDSQAPFALSQVGMAQGTWTYRATAWNSQGQATTSADLVVTVGTAAITAGAGGSNLIWYFTGQPGAPNPHGQYCEREPYAIINSYHRQLPGSVPFESKNRSVRTYTQNLLRELYNSGQRRLRIGLYIANDIEQSVDTFGVSQTTIQPMGDSGLPAQYTTNLSNYLADIRAAGFEEVQASIFWVGCTPDGSGTACPSEKRSPWQWTKFETVAFNRWWNVIVQMRAALAASGIAFRTDLTQEILPPSWASGPWKQFVSQGWQRYIANYPAQESVGFSAPSGVGAGCNEQCARNDLSSRIQNIPTTFGATRPGAIDVHLYESPGVLLGTAVDGLRNLGGTTPLVIGETFYNDSNSANLLNQAIQQKNYPVKYLLQWPITAPRNTPTECVIVPRAWDQWQSRGF